MINTSNLSDILVINRLPVNDAFSDSVIPDAISLIIKSPLINDKTAAGTDTNTSSMMNCPMILDLLKPIDKSIPIS